MALITPEEYLLFIGSTVSPTPQLTAICEGVSAVVENYTGRDFELRSRIEYYSGNGTQTFTLRHRPVSSITNLWYSPNAYFEMGSPFDSDTLLDPTSDYVLDIKEYGQPSNTGIVIKPFGIWTLPFKQRETFKISRDFDINNGNIKVQYVSGYDPIPADIKMGCVQLISRMKNVYLKYGAPIESEQLGDWSYTLATSLLKSDPEIGSLRQILSKYREIPW